MAYRFCLIQETIFKSITSYTILEDTLKLFRNHIKLNVSTGH